MSTNTPDQRLAAVDAEAYHAGNAADAKDPHSMDGGPFHAAESRVYRYHLTAALQDIARLEAELCEERDRLSHIAAALKLAPYGGGYNPENVLPALKRLEAENAELRKVATLAMASVLGRTP